MSRSAQLKIATFLTLRKCGVSTDVVRHLIKRYCKWFDWETEELLEELEWRKIQYFSTISAAQWQHLKVCSYVETEVDCSDALMNSGMLIKDGKKYRRIAQDIERIMRDKNWDIVCFPSLKKHPPTVAQKYNY